LEVCRARLLAQGIIAAVKQEGLKHDNMNIMVLNRTFSC
jgi:hypothetical protein